MGSKSGTRIAWSKSIAQDTLVSIVPCSLYKAYYKAYVCLIYVLQVPISIWQVASCVERYGRACQVYNLLIIMHKKLFRFFLLHRHSVRDDRQPFTSQNRHPLQFQHTAKLFVCHSHIWWASFSWRKSPLQGHIYDFRGRMWCESVGQDGCRDCSVSWDRPERLGPTEYLHYSPL